MALDFSRKVNYTMGNFSPVDATADDTHLYVLAIDTSVRQARIYKFDKQGASVSYISVSYFVFPNQSYAGLGIVKVGNGFGYAYITSSYGVNIALLTASGDVTRTIQLQNESAGAYNVFENAIPRAIAYDTGSSEFVLAYRWVQRVEYLSKYDGNGRETAYVTLNTATYKLTSGLGGFIAAQSTGSLTSLALFSSALGDTGLNQTIQAVTLSGLAFSQNQLIVFDADEIFFYGPEPLPPPVGPVPVRQLFANYEGKAERFDVVRDSGGFEVIANNVEILRQTALGLVGVAGTQTLTQRFAQVEITPVWTVPNAKIGDKIFSHSGAADTEPSAVPTNRTVYTIQGFSDVGPTYRQSFICTAVG